MLGRQEAELRLGPFLPAGAEEAAGSHGDLRLHLLVARRERIPRRVEEAEDTLLLVGLESVHPERREPGRAEHREAHPGTQRNVHHRQQREPDQEREHRHAQVLLSHDQTDRDRDDQAWHEEVAQAMDRRRGIPAEPAGERQDHPDLGELGRLEASAEEPRPRAARLLRDGEREEKKRNSPP